MIKLFFKSNLIFFICSCYCHLTLANFNQCSTYLSNLVKQNSIQAISNQSLFDLALLYLSLEESILLENTNISFLNSVLYQDFTRRYTEALSQGLRRDQWTIVLSEARQKINKDLDDKNQILTEEQKDLKKYTPWNILKTINQKNLKITNARFSPDGSRIVLGLSDYTIKIIDLETETVVHTLEGHNNSLRSLDFSADGTKIISASTDTNVIIWDYQSGEKILTFREHFSFANSAQFSPDGTKVVSASNDKRVLVWNADTGELIHSLRFHTEEIFSARFSSDGKYIVSAAGGNRVVIWDTLSGEIIHSLRSMSFRSFQALFSLDGKYVFSGGNSNLLEIWNTQTGDRIDALKGHTDVINSIEFSRDQKFVLTASLDRTIIVRDATTLEMVNTINYLSAISSAQFSPDGELILVVSDGNVYFWSQN